MTAAAAPVPEPDPDPIPGPVFGAPSGAGPVFGVDERASLEFCLVDPSVFDAGTVLEFARRAQVEESRWAAQRARFLAELASRDRSADRWVAEEVGAALRWSPARAMSEVKNACQLRAGLPATFGKLARGEITPGQARLVIDASYKLPADSPETTAAFDEGVAAGCGELSEPETRQFVRRQLLRADPAGSERRHAQAVKDRYVRLTAADDGMALLTAFLPAPEAVACMQRLDQAARRHPQAQRSTGGVPEDARTLAAPR